MINPLVAGSLIAAGADIIGGMSANAGNVREAAKNRAWQERMRATQYQTAVSDMRAAGLNPALAYAQGGAGTPGGGAATIDNAMSRVASSARDAMRIKSEVDVLKNTAEKTRKEGLLVDDQASKLRSDASLNHVLEVEAQGRIASMDLEREIRKLDLPRARAESEVAKDLGSWGPIIDRILRVVESGTDVYRATRGRTPGTFSPSRPSGFESNQRR